MGVSVKWAQTALEIISRVYNVTFAVGAVWSSPLKNICRKLFVIVGSQQCAWNAWLKLSIKTVNIVGLMFFTTLILLLRQWKVVKLPIMRS